MSLPLKTVELPRGIVITIMEMPGMTNRASVRSDLRECCAFCGDTDCHFDCDESQNDEDEIVYDYDGEEVLNETEEEVIERLKWNAAIDGLEFLILTSAESGIDVASKIFRRAVINALQKIDNYYS